MQRFNSSIAIQGLSYSMIVLYIRDHDGLATNVTQNQPHNTFIVHWQYWCGISKPKSIYGAAKIVSVKLLQNLKNLLQNFLLTE